MQSIREVLSPLLIISYVLGLRLWIIEFPISYLRWWFSISYMLLYWLIYCFLLKFTVISYTTNMSYSTAYLICFWLDILITLLSVVFGVYHNKKFSNCLKKIDIVDDTLLNIGITTDYHKFYKKSVWLVLGWLVIVIFMNCGAALWMIAKNNYDILAAMYIAFMRNYCTYINLINDLIITSVLRYVRLKFDQINKYLLNLSKDNKYKIKRISENLVSHQHRSAKIPSNEWIIWILMHLHLELRKISYEINSIFGIQMTCKMGSNFLWLAFDLRETFNVIFINNFIEHNRTLYHIINIFWICLDSLKLFLINYICETVSVKANATGNLINRIPYFTSNFEIRENILQLQLQIAQKPIRFYGIGFFQFGYKFLQGFSSSITTVLVLLIQAHINKQTSLDDKM